MEPSELVRMARDQPLGLVGTVGLPEEFDVARELAPGVIAPVP